MASKRKVITGISALIAIIGAGALGVWIHGSATPSSTTSTHQTAKNTHDTPSVPTDKPIEQITGETVSVGDAFHILVPDGWQASIATQSTFLAIQYARPNQLNTLVYDKQKPAAVDYNGIPAWNGLTEHFYVRAITTPSQAFNPADHAEITSEPFTFNDGTVGKKYLVTKHAAEAQKWGGLLKDDTWYGRVFVYSRDGTTIEAHLAFYPSTKIDQKIFEKVAATITP